MEQFGDALRVERESKRITLETICEVTKVSIRHLEALEAGRYTSFRVEFFAGAYYEAI